MRRISMAGSDVAVTDDRIAALVLEYAMHLGRAGTTDTVTVPVADGGVPDEASLLLGPASQIAVTANDRLHLEKVELPGVDAAVLDLRRRIRALSGESEPEERGTSTEAGVPLGDPATVFPDFDAFQVDGRADA